MQNRLARILGCCGIILMTLSSCVPPEDVQVPVENDLQRQVDWNSDGFLQRGEVEELVFSLQEELREPHNIGNPLMEIFDENRDGFLDEQELDIARDVLCFEMLPGIFKFNRPLARKLDRDNNQQINPFESQAVKEFLFFEMRLNRPRDVEEDWDRAMDLNKDGFVSEDEIGEVRYSILFNLIQVPGEIQKWLRLARENRQPGEPGQSDRQEWSIPVSSRVHEVIDLNGDGRVDEFELREVAARYKDERIGTGDVTDPNSLMGRLDLNGDGKLKHVEIEQIEGFFRKAWEQLDKMAEREPGLKGVNAVPLREPMDHLFDFNEDGKISPEELADILPAFDKMEKRPHAVKNELESRVDLNQDSFISLEEIREVGNRLVQLERELMQPGNLGTEGKVVETLLEELGDTNDDRFLDPEEIRILENNLRAPHPVKNKFDRRIDFNGNGEVERFEIDKALRGGEVWLENDNREVPDKYKAKTPVDGIFDLDEDGFISQKEVKTAIDFFLQGPRRINPDFKLARIFDLNKDGFFSEEEMQFILDNFLRPHPANYDFEIDQRSDKNKNNFIEPEEIGVAAGHTAEGIFDSFEGIIEQKLMRQGEQEQPVIGEPTPVPVENVNQPENIPTSTPTPAPDAATLEPDTETTIFQKKINVKGKKLAIVDLKTAEEIESDFSDAIIMFVENAFVNIGTASVVDRQNISRIISEYQFQASELSDSTTAVQIGKLAGADVIVIGALNYIGKMYYLNIKLIDVTTAEILGSSIATAGNDTEFFDTCNTAVSKLF